MAYLVDDLLSVPKVVIETDCPRNTECNVNSWGVHTKFDSVVVRRGNSDGFCDLCLSKPAFSAKFKQPPPVYWMLVMPHAFSLLLFNDC